MGLLVFVIGFSTIWIMCRLYADITHLQKCIDRVCTDLDELRNEVVKGEFNGKE